MQHDRISRQAGPPRQRRSALRCGALALAVATIPMATQAETAPPSPYAQAMTQAQTLVRSRALTRAQLVLRRAADLAPNADARALAVARFRQVQRANRWRTDLVFSIAPNSNVNNGSRRERVQLFDLPFEFVLGGASRALPGVQFDAGVRARYRLRETGRSLHALTFAAQNRTYQLSREAKEIAPTARGRDYAFSQVSMGYELKTFAGPGYTFPLQAGLSVGRSWYGYEPHSDFARLTVTQGYRVTERMRVYVSGSLEHEASRSGGADASIAGLGLGLDMALAIGGALHLSAFARQSRSGSSSLDYHQAGVTAQYDFARPIAGVDIGVGLTASRKVHETSNYSRFGRKDSTVTARVTGRFGRIAYFGFVPTVTLTASRTKSTIGLFETQGLGMELGLQSVF